MKTAFWFRLRLRRLRSSKNLVVGVESRSGRTKPITKCGNVHCDWFILLLLLLTPITWFSLNRKRWSHKRIRKKMETFWFFDSDAVALMAPLTTPIFDPATTLLMIPTPTPSLVKTSPKTDIQGSFFLFLTLR